MWEEERMQNEKQKGECEGVSRGERGGWGEGAEGWLHKNMSVCNGP